MSLPREITIGDKYRPAMQLLTQQEADAYFELCVEHCMSWGATRKAAEEIERANLGYFAGYYDHEVGRRVQRLFRCVHPIFGAVRDVPVAEALEAGLKDGARIVAQEGNA